MTRYELPECNTKEHPSQLHLDALEARITALEAALSELRKEQEEERERMGRELVGVEG